MKAIIRVRDTDGKMTERRCDVPDHCVRVDWLEVTRPSHLPRYFAWHYRTEHVGLRLDLAASHLEGIPVFAEQ